MRKLFTLFLAFTALMTVGCDDTEREEIADRVVLSRDNVVFAETGGTAAVAVASPSDWTASCPESWITLTPTEGRLTLTASGNIYEQSRSAVISVKSATSEAQIEVHQSYTKDAAILNVFADKTIEFDSEQDSRIFSVESNGDWEVSSKADWLTIVKDEQRGMVEVSAARNSGEQRTAELSVTARKGSSTATNEPIQVSQISYDQNPYYKLLGAYGLYATNWYYGGSALGVGGTGSYCTIEQNEYRKSVYIKDLFIKGTVVDATFNEDGSLEILLGKQCLTQEISETVTRFVFLTQLNMGVGSFHSGLLQATPGKGKDDDGVERDALLLSGFESGYTSLGLTAYQSGSYASFNDVYYATGTIYFIRQQASEATSALTAAAAQITPAAGGFSALLNK